MEILSYVAIIAFSYATSAILFAKVFSGMTEEEWGDDSWGAASTLEKTGKKWKFFAVIACDTLKAFFPVYFFVNLAPYMGYDMAWALALSSVSVILGHNFPIDMKNIHGGRGLACGFGALLAASWYAGLAGFASLIVWIFITNIILKRKLSLNFKNMLRENIPGRVFGIIAFIPVLFCLVGTKPAVALLPMLVIIIIHHWRRLKDYKWKQ